MLKIIKEGEVIIWEGDKTDKMYKIVSGRVELYVGYGSVNEQIIGILSAGRYFGEIGLFTGRESIYTVVAYCDSSILEIEKENLDVYVQHNYRDLLNIMSDMANAAYNLKMNFQMIAEDLVSVMEEKENNERLNELKQRIQGSSITKEFIRYGIKMGADNKSTFDRKI